MAQISVTVENDVYSDTYSGTSVTVDEGVNGQPVVTVKREDGSYTTHKLQGVTSIELEE